MDRALSFLVEIGAPSNAQKATSSLLRSRNGNSGAAGPAVMPPPPPRRHSPPVSPAEAAAVAAALCGMGFAADAARRAVANGCRTAEAAVAWCLEQPEEAAAAAENEDEALSDRRTTARKHGAPPSPAVGWTPRETLAAEEARESVVEVGDDLSGLGLGLDPPKPSPRAAVAAAVSPSDAASPAAELAGDVPVDAGGAGGSEAAVEAVGAAVAAAVAASGGALTLLAPPNAFAALLRCDVAPLAAAVELANRADPDGFVHVAAANAGATASGVRVGDVVVGLAGRQFGAAPPPPAAQVSLRTFHARFNIQLVPLRLSAESSAHALPKLRLSLSSIH
jgi:hypothetical protein